MKRILRDKGLLFLVFLTFFIITEAITFRWVDFTFLPRFLYVDLLVAFAFSSVILLMKSNKLAIIYLSALLGFVMILFMINATMYGVYLDLFSLQQLQLIGEATAVFNFEHLSLSSIAVAALVFTAYLITMRLAYRFLQKQKTPTPNYFAKALFMFAVSGLFVFAFFTSDIPVFAQYAATNNITTFKRSSLEKYGLLGYYTKEAEIIIMKEQVTPPETTQTTTTDLTTDSAVDTSADNTTDNKIGDIFEPTDYFGLLEGKNVITLMLESIQPFGINEVLTPNLWKLMHEGLYFPNNYSENKTNVSEMIGITGNYPTINFLPSSYDYDFSFSVPNILKDRYVTSYFHDNVPTFYSRGSLMPQLGFENLYFHEDLYPGEPIWTWNGDYTLDSVTIEKIMPLIVAQEEPFYSYWATLSTHGPYNYGPENKALFEELGYFAKIDQAEADGTWVNILKDSTADNVLRIRHYQAAVMDLDAAIGRMLAELETNGLLDDTLIVLFGDHNVYYHDLYLTINQADATDYFNMEMYHTFFAIYNPLLTETYLDKSGADSTYIDKFVSPYSVVPTVLDLLGIEFDPDFYLGDSVFSNRPQVFYSNKLTGLFDNLLYSDDGSGIIYYRDILHTSDEHIDAFLERSAVIIEKIEYINNHYLKTQTTKTTNDD